MKIDVGRESENMREYTDYYDNYINKAVSREKIESTVILVVFIIMIIAGIIIPNI